MIDYNDQGETVNQTVDFNLGRLRWLRYALSRRIFIYFNNINMLT